MKACLIAATVFGALIGNSVSAEAAEGGWAERIDVTGDFRLRYEGIDEDFEVQRNRMRFRGRLGVAANVSDDIKIVFRLATGGDDPVSSNQTFDDGFSTKDVGLDLAYVDWKIADGLHFYGGKMKNPLFRAGSVALVWDSDLNLEGIALKYDSGKFFGTVGGFSVEERSNADDSFLYVLQGGVEFPLGESNMLTIGAGYFAYTNTVGNTPFHDGRAKGNTLDGGGNYANEYKDAEVFAQFDSSFVGWPLQAFVHYATNTEASIQDTALAFGVKLGAAKKKGQSQYAWTYQDIEADAVIGTFNESDFGGGGADSNGHILKARYGLSDKILVGGTLYINDVDRFQGIKHDYRRVQIDLEFKFD